MEKSEIFLRELSPPELLSFNGGDSNPIVRRLSPWAALIGLAIYFYDNWDEFVDGVKEGYASTQNK